MTVQRDLHSIHITHRLTLLSIWLLEGNTPSVLEDDITAARNILNYTEIVAFDEILREITIITALTGFATAATENLNNLVHNGSTF